VHLGLQFKEEREKEEKWREGHLNRRSEVAGLCGERVEKNGSGCTFSVQRRCFFAQQIRTFALVPRVARLGNNNYGDTYRVPS